MVDTTTCGDEDEEYVSASEEDGHSFRSCSTSFKLLDVGEAETTTTTTATCSSFASHLSSRGEVRSCELRSRKARNKFKTRAYMISSLLHAKRSRGDSGKRAAAVERRAGVAWVKGLWGVFSQRTRDFMEKPSTEYSSLVDAETIEDPAAMRRLAGGGRRRRMELELLGHKSGGSFITIHPQSLFKTYWDTVVVVVVVIACFHSTIQAAFTPVSDLAILRSQQLNNEDYVSLCVLLVCEVIFVMDIVVFFFVGFNRLGITVLDRSLIRRNYFRTVFFWDFLAALPILFYPITFYIWTGGCGDSLCVPEAVYLICFYVPLLMLLKIPSGLARSIHLRNRLSDAFGTTLCDMLMLICLFIVLTNFFTCLWFITMAYNPSTNGFKDWVVAGTGNNWLTTQADAGDELVRGAIDCWVLQGDFCTFTDRAVLYINCFYWASNAGDGFDTVQTLEKLNAILVTIVFNNGFFAFILASVAFGLQELNRGWKRRAEYRIKIDAVNEFMRENSVSAAHQSEVRDYFNSVWLPKQVNFTETNLMDEIPIGLRKRIMRGIVGRVIVASKFYEKYFKEKEMEKEWSHIKLWIEKTAENVMVRYFQPQQYIVKQGETGTELFILKSGKVRVLIHVGGKEKEVATLGPGAYFGDLSLLGLTDRRSASIMTLSNATVYLITKEKFDEILQMMPDDGRWIREVMMGVCSDYVKHSMRGK